MGIRGKFTRYGEIGMPEISEYIDTDYEESNDLSMDPVVAATWQYHDEIDYQVRMATSYPQDADAIFAANWLRGQGAW
jgi:hypothetical protein